MTSHMDKMVANIKKMPLKDRCALQRFLTDHCSMELKDPLDPDQYEEAKKTLIRLFPRTTREFPYPIPPGQQVAGMIFIPARGATPDSEGAYGTVINFGNFGSDEEFFERAKLIIRQYDSRWNMFPVPVCRMGVLTTDYDKWSVTVDEVGDDDDDEKEKIMKNREDDKKIINNIKKTEDILEEAEAIRRKDEKEKYKSMKNRLDELRDDVEGDPDPEHIDFYCTQEWGLAQHKKYKEEIETKIDELQEKIDQLEVKREQVETAMEIVNNKLAEANDLNPYYRYMYEDRIRTVHRERGVPDDAEIYNYINRYEIPDDPEIKEKIKELKEKWVY